MTELAGLELKNDLELQGKILDYIAERGNDTSFTDFFWKKCEPHPNEIRRYPAYVDALILSRAGKNNAEISRAIGVNAQSVRGWIRFEKRPKLAITWACSSNSDPPEKVGPG